MAQDPVEPVGPSTSASDSSQASEAAYDERSRRRHDSATARDRSSDAEPRREQDRRQVPMPTPVAGKPWSGGSRTVAAGVDVPAGAKGRTKAATGPAATTQTDEGSAEGRGGGLGHAASLGSARRAAVQERDVTVRKLAGPVGGVPLLNST